MSIEELITNPWFWLISLTIDFFWLSKLIDWVLGTKPKGQEG